MVKKHSTGALSLEEHETQDKRYAEGHEYDYLFVGMGSAALSCAALLTKKGYKVCMLEAHDLPGGYVHTFKMADYSFCAQIHYIWGCGEGDKIYTFLQKLGLEKEVTFELMGPEGYDLMSLPDGNKVFVPYGFDRLIENICDKYPDQRKALNKFVGIMRNVRREMKFLPSGKIKFFDYLKLYKVWTLFKYRKATLQKVFDECGLSKEAQLVLCGQAGDYGLPPARLSFIIYVALFGGYNTGAYYPTKHFKFYIDRLVQSITDNEGCHTYYETKVTKFNTEGDKMVSVETENGKTFTAKNIICNMDPQAASHMIGREKFSQDDLKKLDYEYSESGVMIYLALKDIKLEDYGFGSYNIWHMEDWDMNEMWERQAGGDFSKLWFFLSTPSLHTKDRGNCPEGVELLEVTTFTDYKPFKEKSERSYEEYNQYKIDLAMKMMDVLEKKFIPNVRDHIALQVIGSPVTNEDYVMAPNGNAYGSTMTPKQMDPKNRLTAKTPFKNFWWCNASSGFAGVSGTVSTGLQLYEDLTGDYFYDSKKAPTDDELVKRVQLQIDEELEKGSKHLSKVRERGKLVKEGSSPVESL
jgi:all-trans-retinol 13,14-reductase